MTGPDRFRELAPLYALGALDGEDLAAFEAHVAGCADCRAEVAAYAEVAGRVGASVPPVPPPAALRARVLAAAAAPAAQARPTGDVRPAAVTAIRRPARRWPVGLAAAAALVLGVAFLLRASSCARSATARRTCSSRWTTSSARCPSSSCSSRRRRRCRISSRGPARASRCSPACNPRRGPRRAWCGTRPRATRSCWPRASQPLEPGKAYEVWVIGASNRPVPAGVFQPAADGRALVHLPRVADTAEPRTFAVTIEPAAGSPAPTGPMVLAGAVS